MRTVALPEDCSDEAFRAAARACLARRLPPDELLFTTERSGGLFTAAAIEDRPGSGAALYVPRDFAGLVSRAICNSAADRFGLLYRLLWRIQAGERHVLECAADADVRRAQAYARAVDRDVHRMHAFVRFSERLVDGQAMSFAWFEPQHRVLRLAAPFFVDRFRNIDWLIATPMGTAQWRGGALEFGPPIARPNREGPEAAGEELWATYYRSTFNPARLRVDAMVAHMPKRHWATMPETVQIPDLVRAAGARVQTMTNREPDTPPKFAEAVARRAPSAAAVPSDSLAAIRRAAQSCANCALCGPATQTVFGEGPSDARIVLVGEQPGDREDLVGRPFVGPAGQLLDRALAEAGIERARVYVTNAVKHFKFEPRGKRRIHSKPAAAEVHACRPWLRRELDVVRPDLIVALGATAVLGLAGHAISVTRERGRILEVDGRAMLVTVHPSYLLRLRDRQIAADEYTRFVADLRIAAAFAPVVQAAESPPAGEPAASRTDIEGRSG